MDQISNTKKLGIIVLAAKYLANLNLSFRRPISAAARALGVSRKTGYQTAKRIEEELRDRPKEAPAEDKRQREVYLLRIKNQVLRYERDHGDVRFAAQGPHLPEDAKSLCVRILRDFRGKLSLGDIAEAIGVATSSLSRWDHEADAQRRFPQKPERRGTFRHATPQEAKQVVEAFENLERDMTLEEFTKHYNALYPQAPLDRRTITRILQGSGHHAVEPRTGRKDYHGKFTVYFPGAQAAVDGKQTTVHFTGEPEESVIVGREVAVDVASGAVLGDVLTSQENAEGVTRVVIKAREECQSLLAVLADNRSSNTAAEAQWAMEEHSEIGSIFTFPYHARTNGHVEGFFGQFSRIVGPLEINDSSRATLAQSLVDVVWRIFIHFYNHSPRERLDGKSPVEYLRTYTVLPKKMEEARTGLREQQRRSRKSREPNPRLSDPVFRALVERILTTHGFTDVELDRALESLVAFDTAIIESASCAFSAQSERDGFEKSKRHFAYFMGIARNKQRALDKDRRNAAADVLRTARLLDENAASEQHLEEERRQERQELTTQPEAVVVKYAKLLMQGRFRWLREKWLKHIREGLRALCRLGRTSNQVLESLAVAIRGLPEFAEDIKDHMVRLLSEEIEQLTGS